jgi:hypothetical protein
MARLFDRVSQISTPDNAMDTSRTGTSVRRFEALLNEHSAEGTPDIDHIRALTKAWTDRQLAINKALGPTVLVHSIQTLVSKM